MGDFKLKAIKLADGNRKVVYDYEVSNNLKKYFDLENRLYVKYEKSVEQVPESIIVIPLLANIMPIAWFAGFDVYVDAIDETFFNALSMLKKEFMKHHDIDESKSTLYCNHKVNNQIDGTESILLFSGGLDSFESLTRNYDDAPYLASIHGADVEINDTVRWEQFMNFNSAEPIVVNDRLQYIQSNLRDFYTYKVDLLVNVGWWGKVQHGMALLSVLAPLSYMLGANKMLIASSNTNEVDFGWGSTPEIDEKMVWSNVKTIHDGYHLRRTDKIQNVVDFSNKNDQSIFLRVCYSELRDGANCNKCAKCQRTMFGIILANDDPARYGFTVPDNLYEMIFRNFSKNAVMTKGIEYEWKCLQEKAANSDSFFVISDKEKEKILIKDFIALELKEIVNKNSKKVESSGKLKYIIRNRFKGLYELYRKIRY